MEKRKDERVREGVEPLPVPLEGGREGRSRVEVELGVPRGVVVS